MNRPQELDHRFSWQPFFVTALMLGSLGFLSALGSAARNSANAEQAKKPICYAETQVDGRTNRTKVPCPDGVEKIIIANNK